MFLTDSRFSVLSGCPPGRGMPAVPELGALGCINLASLSGCLWLHSASKVLLEASELQPEKGYRMEGSERSHAEKA